MVEYTSYNYMSIKTEDRFKLWAFEIFYLSAIWLQAQGQLWATEKEAITLIHCY